MQIAQTQAYSYECTPCSDAINGRKNRVFDIKSGHDFCRYRNSIQVIYFQISGHINSSMRIRIKVMAKESVKAKRNTPRSTSRRSSSGGLEAEEKLEALLPRLVGIHDHIMLKFHHS